MIDFVRFGEISVNGKIYYSDVFVYWNGKVEMREKSRVITLNDFIRMVKNGGKVVVFGKGFGEFVKVEDGVYDLAREKGVDIFEEESPKAVRIFNNFVKSGERVAAVFLT